MMPQQMMPQQMMPQQMMPQQMMPQQMMPQQMMAKPMDPQSYAKWYEAWMGKFSGTMGQRKNADQ
jgi:hypothetical protein